MNTLRILVVEDHDDGRETLRDLLELVGYDVETASDGLSGLRLALAHRPDVAIVDIGLPLLDGYQFARLVREAERDDEPEGVATVESADAFAGAPAPQRHTLLIALTGYGQPADRRAALAAGFDAHFVKPLDPARLEALLEWAAGSGCASRAGR